MNSSWKIVYFYAKNFSGFYNGMNKKVIELDLEKMIDRELILILGDNGYGKSTLNSILHPLLGTTDKRDEYIRKGKEGIKILKYRRMTDGTELECKIVYTPSSTGHTSKAYVIKTLLDGETIELNPNGNVTSYKEVIAEELGVTDAVLRIASQSDAMKGHVDMTSTERKNNMTEFLPEDSCSFYYSIIDKTYKDMKSRISVIVDNIGKLNNAETLEEYLTSITDEINVLVNKRDKKVGKIKEYETRIKILVEDNNIEKIYNKRNKQLSELSAKIETIIDTLDTCSDILPMQNKSLDNLLELKDSIEKSMSDLGKMKAVLNSNLTSLKSRRNSITDDIEEKKSILSDISSDATLEELESILSKYTDRYNELDSMMKKVSDKVSKDDLLTGYELIQVIRNNLYNIYDNKSGILNDAISDMYNGFKCESELNSLKLKKQKLESISMDITNKLRELNSNNHLKEILDKRPSNCTIDDCPFIVNARKWTTIQSEIEKYEGMVDKSDNEIIKLNTRIDELEDVVNICRNINMLINYIDMNSSLIRKLPYNERYSTREAILKVIEKNDILQGVDKFDPFIEIIELREEYMDLQYKRIPNIENEIKILKTQGKLIDTSRKELNRLYEEEVSIRDDILRYKEQISDIDSKEKSNMDLLSTIDKMISNISDYNETYNKRIEVKDEVDKLMSDMRSLETYRIKLKENKVKLKEIDSELVPLTQKRDYYRMEQIKLVDYKRELKSIEEDMYVAEIIREALSTKEGIPVDMLDFFMDNIRHTANTLLSKAFNGEMYLDIFKIDSKDFKMPFKHRGELASDVRKASSSERSFVSLCLTLAILDELVSGYGIVILDEIDRGFSEGNKYKFVKIFTEYMKNVGVTQAFLTTHSKEYYESYDVGFILFPGHGIKNYDDQDVIKVY